jgi:putative membrane protein
MLQRTFRLTPLIAIATFFAASAFAQAQGAPNLSGGDRKFLDKAAAHGVAEVEMGKLAQQKGASQQVKDFGARMVQDHGKANDELKTLASAKGMAPAAKPDKEHEKKLASLQDKSGTDFDKAYMKEMVADHKKDVAEFRKQAKSAKDPEVKAFAEKTLPTLEAHLKLAQETDKAVRAGGKVASNTATPGASASGTSASRANTGNTGSATGKGNTPTGNTTSTR